MEADRRPGERPRADQGPQRASTRPSVGTCKPRNALSLGHGRGRERGESREIGATRAPTFGPLLLLAYPGSPMTPREAFVAAVALSAQRLKESQTPDHDPALDGADVATLDSLLAYVKSWSTYSVVLYDGEARNLLDDRIDAPRRFGIWRKDESEGRADWSFANELRPKEPTTATDILREIQYWTTRFQLNGPSSYPKPLRCSLSTD